MNQISLEHLLAHEHAKLKELLTHAFGFYLLNLSHHSYSKPIDCPINRQILVKPESGEGDNEAEVVSRWAELPFAPDSIDVMVLSHVFDHCIDIKAILKEAKLILRHDGKLVITGFNPARIQARRLAKVYHGQNLNLRLCSTINHELNQAGFSVQVVKHYSYLATKNPFLAKWVNRILDKVFSGFGCGYVILAQKKTLAVTASGPNWISPLVKPEKAVVPSCRVK